MVPLFSATLFLAAFLLFSIQPMVGKMLLPYFGGTPAVWNVCMVFFQLSLLGGYFYANQLARQSKFKWQAAWHLLFFAAAAASLTPAFQEKLKELNPTSVSPISDLLIFLFLNLGPPLLLLSSTASLLQSWFSSGSHAFARDPYHLYVASNLGSLFGLLLYPLALEPGLALSLQYSVWRICYFFLIGLIACCALWRWRQVGDTTNIAQAPKLASDPSSRWRWLLFSFVPSSLLLGATNYLSTDVAAIPLLWVIPLALYLATFIIAFSRRATAFSSELIFFLGRAAAFGGCIAVLGIVLESNQPIQLFYPAHLVLFFLICLLSHVRLWRSRPSAEKLTEFYLWISVGGALGGIFNTLLAPNLFSVIAEYPILILLGTTFRNGDISGKDTERTLSSDFSFFLLVAVSLFLLSSIVHWSQWEPSRLVNLLVLGPPMILTYRFVRQPRRFALGLLAVYLSGLFFYSGRGYELIYRERTFFGTNKVEQDPQKRFRMFFHGSTLHGQQWIDPQKSSEPLAYFSRESPIAKVFGIIRMRNPGFRRVGIVGLGAGTLAAYAQKGEAWKFFEIDPGVLRLARDSGYFSFLAGSQASAETEIILGDARLMLQKEPDEVFDLLVLDAFSSDSIPAHLLTKEALQLYWKKLRPSGTLVFNVSSRYFNFGPTIAALAQASGARAFFREHNLTEEVAEKTGAAPSSWIVMLKPESPLAGDFERKQWQLLKPGGGRIWTDDYSNVLSLFFQ